MGLKALQACVGRANIITSGVQEGVGTNELFLKFGVWDGPAKVRSLFLDEPCRKYRVPYAEKEKFHSALPHTLMYRQWRAAQHNLIEDLPVYPIYQKLQGT
jgi:hypothetical protein